MTLSPSQVKDTIREHPAALEYDKIAPTFADTVDDPNYVNAEVDALVEVLGK